MTSGCNKVPAQELHDAVKHSGQKETQRGLLSSDKARHGVNSHLLLNGLNRIASSYYSKTGEECEDVYAVSEYFTQAVRVGGSRVISYQEESALLSKYMALLNLCKQKSLILKIDSIKGCGKKLIAPHLTCDISSSMFEILKTLTANEWIFDANFSQQGITLTLAPDGQFECGVAFRSTVDALEKQISSYSDDSMLVSAVWGVLADSTGLSERPRLVVSLRDKAELALG